MSLLLASKNVVPLHIHLGAFSGFSIISFNNLVNVKWDDKRAFNQKFGTLSIPGDFPIPTGQIPTKAFPVFYVIEEVSVLKS